MAGCEADVSSKSDKSLLFIDHSARNLYEELAENIEKSLHIELEDEKNKSVSNESFIDHCFNNISKKSQLSSLQEDFNDFKKCVFQRLSSIEESLHVHYPIQAKNTDEKYITMLVESLKERISFLEDQVSVKDKLIEKLFEKKTLTNKSSPSNSDENLIKSELQNTQGKSLSSLSKARNNLNNNINNGIRNNEPTIRNNGNKIKVVSKRIEIIGDSLLNGIDERGFNINNKVVKLRKHPGSTSRDILDHIQPIIRSNPDEIIIHTGTNDLTNDINLLNNAKKIVKSIRDSCPSTKITFSNIIMRHDNKDLEPKLILFNKHLNNYCNQQHLGYIDNGNIDTSGLGSKRLHLNRKGNSFFARNLINHINLE